MRAIDSSTLVKYLTHEENWERVSSILREGCVSLDLALKEVGNAILKKHKLGEITQEQAAELFSGLLKSDAVRFHDQRPFLEEAFKLGLETGSSVYDCVFLEAARSKVMTLVTSDRRQAETAKTLGIEVILIT